MELNIRISESCILQLVPIRAKKKVDGISSFYIGKYPVTEQQWAVVMGTEISKSFYNRPTTMVPYCEAVEFCEKLGKMAGRRFRLPTTQQWEYAWSCGLSSPNCVVQDDRKVERIAWCKSNSDGRTHPVGELEPNSWSLYDMLGNVWEWCSDTTTVPRTSYLGDTPITYECELREVRGSSFEEPYIEIRSRRKSTCEDYDLGLRVVASWRKSPTKKR
ncbi:MAG: formylglycine-generating enzyme family protein [bacterium]|nr:formylglycine-generating enzyme family protein [bacterium]